MPFWAWHCKLESNVMPHQVECFKEIGNRVNSFGAVHLCDENETWFGPVAWCSENEAWSYEYQLRRTGILSAPILYLKKWYGGKNDRKRTSFMCTESSGS